MAKISPVSAKYIIHATIDIDGIVERPDVIGAIFGQTEGLIGSDLELRELQRSGRIGRIEVDLKTEKGKTRGTITIPSSMDKAETSIIAATLEVIDRIGPCDARIRVEKIEDVRVKKRQYVVDRAKELLQSMLETTIPDSQELAEEVANAVRVMEIQEYGRDKLPAGPAVDEADEIILVEGRADVVNLLKHGFKNVIALNGSTIPPTIQELSRRKTVTAFLDGDRGGDLILKKLLEVAEIDFVARAPDGKEVEELTKKEIHKALRGRVTVEQAKDELAHTAEDLERANRENRERVRKAQQQRRRQQSEAKPPRIQGGLSEEEKKQYKQLLEDLIGTKAAYVLGKNLEILGKVPVSELKASLEGISDVHALVLDERVTSDLAQYAARRGVKFMVGMSKENGEPRGMRVLTVKELE